MKVGYIRVSTQEQHEDRQIEGLKKYNLDKIYSEKISGKSKDRPQLKAMLDFVREGDTVYVHDFSRLARNTKDLLTIVEDLKSRGVALVSNKEGLDTSTPTGKLMLTMVAAIYEFERTNLLERQREGIAVQKEKDKHRKPEDKHYKGRKAIDIPNFDEYYQKYLNREIGSKTQLAKVLGVSRPTLDKLIKEHEAQHNTTE